MMSEGLSAGDILALTRDQEYDDIERKIKKYS